MGKAGFFLENHNLVICQTCHACM